MLTYISSSNKHAKAAKAETTDRSILQEFIDLGIKDIFSVPCSITDSWHSLAQQRSKSGEVNLTITNHEGNLVGMAAGFYFGTGRPALVHMQNSGLCNAGDGFITFANRMVYGIPMTVLITKRGCNASDDSEPHQEIGKRTDGLVEVIFREGSQIFDSDSSGTIAAAIESAVKTSFEGNIGIVKLAPEDFKKSSQPKLPRSFRQFSSENFIEIMRTKGDGSKPKHLKTSRSITRDEAMDEILRIHSHAAILFCNGFDARAAQDRHDHLGNFYNVGYMGGTLAIGWALAKCRPDLEVVVVDGDQNAEMSCMKDHLMNEYPPNLFWYILNNHIGASVGTTESIPLAPPYYELARVIETKPDKPGSFSCPRVKARGVYFAKDEVIPQEDGLYQLAQRFKTWVSKQ